MASLFTTAPFANNWAAPLAVSPLIRAARWGALVSGVVYGVTRFNALKEPAKAEHDAYLAKKAVTDRAAAEQKEAASIAELAGLAAAAGIVK